MYDCHPYIVGIFVITTLIHCTQGWQSYICHISDCYFFVAERVRKDLPCFRSFFSPWQSYIFFHLVINVFAITSKIQIDELYSKNDIRLVGPTSHNCLMLLSIMWITTWLLYIDVILIITIPHMWSMSWIKYQCWCPCICLWTKKYNCTLSDRFTFSNMHVGLLVEFVD